MHVIAEQQVDIEHLNTALAKKDSEIGNQRQALLTLRTDLGSGKSIFVYAGRHYQEKDVKRDLATRFERFKAAEEILARTARFCRLMTDSGCQRETGRHAAGRRNSVKLEQLSPVADVRA
jgi:hypothetical protein